MQTEQPAKDCALGNPAIRGSMEWEQTDAIVIKINETFLVLSVIWQPLTQPLPTAAYIKRQRKMIKCIPVQNMKTDRLLTAKRNYPDLWGQWSWIQKNIWWPTHSLLHESEQIQPSENR